MVGQGNSKIMNEFHALHTQTVVVFFLGDASDGPTLRPQIPPDMKASISASSIVQPDLHARREALLKHTFKPGVDPFTQAGSVCAPKIVMST